MPPANDNRAPETAAERARRLDAAVRVVQQRRRMARPAQEFDTSALPLFGDQGRQLTMF